MLHLINYGGAIDNIAAFSGKPDRKNLKLFRMKKRVDNNFYKFMKNVIF